MTITIVIATKDRAAMLDDALISLRRQTGAPAFDVVVVDNGSTDATAEVVDRHAEAGAFPIARLFYGTPNRGAARNRGIAAATGDLVLFIDDDVILPSGFLAAHARAHAEAEPRAVSGPILNVANRDARPVPSAVNYSAAFFCTCNVSVPRAALESVKGFDEQFDLYGWEDTELGIRLRESGVARAFAWDAYLWHIKPPAVETLDVQMRKAVEKGRMAARFVRKVPTTRARLATGAYGISRIVSRVTAPAFLLPLYAGLAERAPRPIAALARSRLLDGLYVDELTRALRDEPRPPRP